MSEFQISDSLLQAGVTSFHAPLLQLLNCGRRPLAETGTSARLTCLCHVSPAAPQPQQQKPEQRKPRRKQAGPELVAAPQADKQPARHTDQRPQGRAAAAGAKQPPQEADTGGHMSSAGSANRSLALRAPFACLAAGLEPVEFSGGLRLWRVAGE